MGGKSSAGAQYDLAQMVLAIYTGSSPNPGGRGKGKQSGCMFTSCSQQLNMQLKSHQLDMADSTASGHLWPKTNQF